jgi:pimeloyl-ACP methyl ester carboxylesterase
LQSPEIDGWRGELSSVSCPVLLLTGDQDVTVTAEVATEAAAACPRLDEVHLAGAGHSVRRDRFEGYTAALDAFLGRVHGIAA